MNIRKSFPWWIILIVILGTMTGVISALYVPVWVIALITLVLILISVASLLDYGYFGRAWIIMFGVTIFNIPLWVAWFVVIVIELTKALQNFP